MKSKYSVVALALLQYYTFFFFFPYLNGFGFEVIEALEVRHLKRAGHLRAEAGLHRADLEEHVVVGVVYLIMW